MDLLGGTLLLASSEVRRVDDSDHVGDPDPIKFLGSFGPPLPPVVGGNLSLPPESGTRTGWLRGLRVLCQAVADLQPNESFRTS